MHTKHINNTYTQKAPVMVGEVDGVNRIHIKAQHLQCEGGALVADVPVDDMALDAEHPV